MKHIICDLSHIKTLSPTSVHENSVLHYIQSVNPVKQTSICEPIPSSLQLATSARLFYTPNTVGHIPVVPGNGAQCPVSMSESLVGN